MFSQQAWEGAVIWKHHMEFHMWHFSTACGEEAEPKCTISSAFSLDSWIWDFSIPPKCLLQVIKYWESSRLCLLSELIKKKRRIYLPCNRAGILEWMSNFVLLNIQSRCSIKHPKQENLELKKLPVGRHNNSQQYYSVSQSYSQSIANKNCYVSIISQPSALMCGFRCHCSSHSKKNELYCCCSSCISGKMLAWGVPNRTLKGILFS